MSYLRDDCRKIKIGGRDSRAPVGKAWQDSGSRVFRGFLLLLRRLNWTDKGFLGQYSEARYSKVVGAGLFRAQFSEVRWGKARGGRGFTGLNFQTPKERAGRNHQKFRGRGGPGANFVCKIEQSRRVRIFKNPILKCAVFKGYSRGWSAIKGFRGPIK